MDASGNYIVCAYCGAPLLIEREKAYRLKYHPQCKRDHDRERHGTREADTVTCQQCGQGFLAKRSDARFCSPRCRTASHRSQHTDTQTGRSRPR
jgi:endogenous inhibitor of DNA gyrase (YacG/DUF329 family)